MHTHIFRTWCPVRTHMLSQRSLWPVVREPVSMQIIAKLHALVQKSFRTVWEHTTKEKKIKEKKTKNPIFSYYNFSTFSDENAVWKRGRAILKASPLASFFAGNEEWCLYWHLSDETDLCWEIPKGAQPIWSVMPVRASPQLFIVGAGLTHLSRYSAQKYWFSVSKIQTPVLSDISLSPTALPSLLSCMSQFQSL